MEGVHGLTRRPLLTELAKRFEQRFGRVAHCGTRAPGRINLIGEHTDYNDGLVLPCAIDRATVVLASPRDDRCVRVFSRELDEERRFQIGAAATRTWVDYVHGVIQAFEAEALTVAGRALALDPDDPHSMTLYAYTLYGLGRFAEAERGARSWLSVSPTSG